MNSNNRIAATLYFIGTWFFFFKNVCVNTLRKGDDDDGDDDRLLKVQYLN